jgi:hypothetical protein
LQSEAVAFLLSLPMPIANVPECIDDTTTKQCDTPMEITHDVSTKIESRVACASNNTVESVPELNVDCLKIPCTCLTILCFEPDWLIVKCPTCDTVINIDSLLFPAHCDYANLEYVASNVRQAMERADAIVALESYLNPTEASMSRPEIPSDPVMLANHQALILAKKGLETALEELKQSIQALHEMQEVQREVSLTCHDHSINGLLHQNK